MEQPVGRKPSMKSTMIFSGIVAALSLVPTVAYQTMFLGGVKPLPLVIVPVAVGAIFIMFITLNRTSLDRSQYTAVENFFFSEEDEVIDFSDEARMLLREPVLSSVQGTPTPLIVAGSDAQERVSTQILTIDPEIQESILQHVKETPPALPPLPTRPPMIHKAVVADTPENLENNTVVPEKNPREVLESRALKEVITDLGTEGYIDALLYCLGLTKTGSLDIVLNAKGPVIGLGARGIRNDDGTTGFTRADVLKMLRKARLSVSANLQGDIQMSGEGQS